LYVSIRRAYVESFRCRQRWSAFDLNADFDGFGGGFGIVLGEPASGFVVRVESRLPLAFRALVRSATRGWAFSIHLQDPA
jgi:hypothetical protein